MHFPRMPIEAESPEQLGYDKIRFNLTESSVRDRTLADLGLVDLRDLTLAYTDHVGHPALRALIAARAGGGLSADNVLLAAGASSALFIIAISLLDAGEHLVVVRPNYATNIETPKSLRALMDASADQPLQPLRLILLTGEAENATSLAQLREMGRRILAADPGASE